VWAFVEGLDLSSLYAWIKAIEGHPGRPPIDPRILVALWLYATLEGVGSARALDRLCAEHDGYRWLAGGVGLNYHTLGAFRVEHADVLDQLLTESVAALLADGLVTLTTVAQDGVRVRAAAGAASYRRRDRLERFLAQADAQVRTLKDELDDDPRGVRDVWPRLASVRRESEPSVFAMPLPTCRRSRRQRSATPSAASLFRKREPPPPIRRLAL